MKNAKKLAVFAIAIATAATMTGCAATDIIEGSGRPDDEITETLPPAADLPEAPSLPDVPVVDTTPKVPTVAYINVLKSGVNIRSGAGTGYSVRGSAQKSTMYALNGGTEGWYETGYKNKPAYISSAYCEVVEMTASEDKRIEAVIAEGTKHLGTKYVYGATRYHDGKGNKLKDFDINAFDCSSLMQYIFYKGAGVNLQLTTRTQVVQGKTVKKSELKRGDLMFFTNSSRQHLTGVERIGHVALFLGDNWILHTASDFAKIEQISSTRWGYFVQGQRMI